MARTIKGVSLQGMDELLKNFDRVKRSLDTRPVLASIVNAAEGMRDDAISRAPLGKGKWKGRKRGGLLGRLFGGSRTWQPGGNLKRGIVAWAFSNQIKGRPAAFVAIDYRIAPHAHLVEFGHGGPHPAGPHPFFRPAISSKRRKARKDISNSALKAIDKVGG